MILLVFMIVGVAWLPGIAMVASDFAAHRDLTLGELVARTPQLLTITYLLVGLVVGGVALAIGFLVIKASTTLVIEERQLVYRRRGAPLVGWFHEHRIIPHAELRHIEVSRERRGTVSRVELRVLSMGGELRLNLGHAVTSPGKGGVSAVKTIQDWKSHPLVRALQAHTGAELQTK